MVRLALSVLPFVWLSTFAFPAPRSEDVNIGAFIPLRIEGEHGTIFEGPIFTRGHNVTTPSGGNHHCDGTNLKAHPFPGPTATSALADAAKAKGFLFDGTFDTEFDDFFITSIGDSPETDTQFWGLLANFVFTPVGGCQERATPLTHILWAFDAFNADAFLFLEGPSAALPGQPVTLTVKNGTEGNPISGASVGHGFPLTDAQGHVTVSFGTRGVQSLKAEKEGTIRSNALEIVVG